MSKRKPRRPGHRPGAKRRRDHQRGSGEQPTNKPLVLEEIGTIQQRRTFCGAQHSAAVMRVAAPLDQLCLRGDITPLQCSAGHNFGELVIRYRQACGYPAPWYRGSGGRASTDPDAAVIRRARQAYDGCQGVLLGCVGASWAAAVEELCTTAELPPWAADGVQRWPWVGLALDALVAHGAVRVRGGGREMEP
jgi:hypothetical protein